MNDCSENCLGPGITLVAPASRLVKNRRGWLLGIFSGQRLAKPKTEN